MNSHLPEGPVNGSSAHVNRQSAGVNGSADAFRAIAEMAGHIAFMID